MWMINLFLIVLGLDIVTPESLFGYEPESSLPPGEQPYTTEKVIIPDTSQFLENSIVTSQSPGPLVSFPKYNNYLQDKSKFDKHSKIFVPLKLLGIKPLESGELITKHSLPDNRAVISYAQYRQAGMLFPNVYDDSVIRRWGVDVIIGSPLISVSILVPEFVEAVSKQKQPKVHFDDIYTDEFEKEKSLKKAIIEPEVKIHENDAQYYRIEDNHRKRRNSATKRLLYKSLSMASLKLPIKLQIWLDSNLTIFNERSNPQCVHWSTVRGSGEWSRVGCRTETAEDWFDKYNDGPLLVNCTCNHLSTFAVLVDVVDLEVIMKFLIAIL